MSALDAYDREVRALLDGLRERREVLERFAEDVANVVEGGGLIYLTGTGHGHMLAEEVFYRAGGLAAVHPVLVPSLMLHEGATRSSRLERLPGLAAEALADTDLGEGDLMVIASNSGRNAFPVEAARVARERGARVVALTSLRHSERVASRDPSGRKLAELADLVVDTGAPYGDAAVPLAGGSLRVGAVSTVAGAYVLNAVVARATELLLQRGVDVDVFSSANAEAGEPLSPDRLAYWRRRVRLL